jgi:hypothetical protein
MTCRKDGNLPAASRISQQEVPEKRIKYEMTKQKMSSVTSWKLKKKPTRDIAT